jgi:hypothetical protein
MLAGGERNPNRCLGRRAVRIGRVRCVLAVFGNIVYSTVDTLAFSDLRMLTEYMC